MKARAAMTKREVTQLLEDWAEGDRDALDRLIPLVVDDLRVIARSYLAREAHGHSIEPTELINDVYIRLAGQRHVSWDNRSQFFAFSAQLMRRLLVDHARRRQAGKRRGVIVPFSEAFALLEEKDPDLIALDDALESLAELDARQSLVVQMRIFGGWTVEEIASGLDIGATTVKRDWSAALLWLRRELSRKRPPGDGPFQARSAR